MARTRDRVPSIVGDAVVEGVTVNDKGGSLSAILKRPIRGDLNPGKQCYGAKIEFEPGVSCVLVAGGKKRIRVAKIANGFVLTIDEGPQEMVDPTTKAILNIYDEMIKAGKVQVVPPAEAERRLADVLESIDRLGTGTRTSRKEPPTPE